MKILMKGNLGGRRNNNSPFCDFLRQLENLKKSNSKPNLVNFGIQRTLPLSAVSSEEASLKLPSFGKAK